MWSDNETAIDLLNVGYLADAVRDTVLDKSLLPVTVGIFGDWGSGKSSLVEITRSALKEREDEGVLCVNFNGWLFEGYEDARAALMGTILEEIQNKRTLSAKAKKQIGTLLKRVDWMRLMGIVGRQAVSFAVGVPSLEGTEIASSLMALADKRGKVDLDKVMKIIKEAPEGETNVRKSIREFRNEFGDLLKETKITNLVVFVDDLDRCLPDTVVETLEAIKLFLFVPRSAFVISADERMVKEAVRRRFPPTQDSTLDIASEYLEKLVQVPVRIPPLAPEAVQRYMTLLFAERELGDGFPKAIAQLPEESEQHDEQAIGEALFGGDPPAAFTESLSLIQQIGDVLATGLNGNPRQVKRFLNTLVLRMKMAESRGATLQLRVLAKLMILEYMRTESFRKLEEWQADQDGQSEQMKQLEPLAAGKHDGEENAAVEEQAGDKFEAKKSHKQPSAELSPELSVWLDDQWLKDWLVSDPQLSSVDLRSYYFVSRDRLERVGVSSFHLSSSAQRAIELLAAESAASRKRGLDQAAGLSASDANAVFQVLAERVRRSESLDARFSPLVTLLELVARRPELFSETLQLLRSLAPSRLGPGVVPRLAELGRKNPPLADSVSGLLTEWKKQGVNQTLAQAATRFLSRGTT